MKKTTFDYLHGFSVAHYSGEDSEILGRAPSFFPLSYSGWVSSRRERAYGFLGWLKTMYASFWKKGKDSISSLSWKKAKYH